MGDTTPRSELDALLTNRRRFEEQADANVEWAAAKCGGNTWCNMVVDKRQLAEYPAMTLLVARGCKIMLIFFICVCLIGLITGFLFQGSLELLEEVNQMSELAAPRVALCAQPWGSSFAQAPTGLTAELVTIPTGVVTPISNYTGIRCPEAASGCHCTDFSRVVMRPRSHGGFKGDEAKRGELTSWDYIRVSFKAGNNDTKNQQFAFGFYDVNLPQQWTYARLGHVTEGDIKFEEVAHGKTEFTDGTPVTRYSFRMAGDSTTTDGATVIQFGYDRFLAYVVASVGSKWSVFSLLTLMITFCAAVNNFGLFEIFFPEKLDEEDPAQLVPSPALTITCGHCCICCKPREPELGSESDLESK